MKQIEIKNSKGEVFFYASKEGGILKLEYEVYGTGKDSGSVESIYSIGESEFPKIAAKYGPNAQEEDIIKILTSIVDSDRVEDFKKDILNGFITLVDKFVWVSFND